MGTTPEVVAGVANDQRWARPAIVVFFGGLTIWIVATAITAATKDDILVPTVILVGSFLVPVAVIVAAFHREESRVGTGLSIAVMMEGFLFAGMVGVIGSALIEVYTLPRVAGTFIGVALIEETTKGIVFVLVARRMRSRLPLDGLVLGAIVGAGFAAFESSGYAFASYIQFGTDHPFVNLLRTELNRASLAPFGHIVWTSLLGGALFAAATPTGRFRITKAVVATYVGVVALHSLWDQAYGWALRITQGITDGTWHLAWPAAAAWVSTPSGEQLHIFNLVYNGIILVLAVTGTGWFVLTWRRYRDKELADIAEAETVVNLRPEAQEDGVERLPNASTTSATDA